MIIKDERIVGVGGLSLGMPVDLILVNKIVLQMDKVIEL